MSISVVQTPHFHGANRAFLLDFTGIFRPNDRGITAYPCHSTGIFHDETCISAVFGRCFDRGNDANADHSTGVFPVHGGENAVFLGDQPW